MYTKKIIDHFINQSIINPSISAYILFSLPENEWSDHNWDHEAWEYASLKNKTLLGKWILSKSTMSVYQAAGHLPKSKWTLAPGGVIQHRAEIEHVVQ